MWHWVLRLLPGLDRMVTISFRERSGPHQTERSCAGVGVLSAMHRYRWNTVDKPTNQRRNPPWAAKKRYTVGLAISVGLWGQASAWIPCLPADATCNPRNTAAIVPRSCFSYLASQRNERCPQFSHWSIFLKYISACLKLPGRPMMSFSTMWLVGRNQKI